MSSSAPNSPQSIIQMVDLGFPVAPIILNNYLDKTESESVLVVSNKYIHKGNIGKQTFFKIGIPAITLPNTTLEPSKALVSRAVIRN
jgi:hypothetical protein